MKNKVIESNLDRIIKSKIAPKSKAHFVNFDIKTLYSELNSIVSEYKKETVDKAVSSEKNLSKTILSK